MLEDYEFSTAYAEGIIRSLRKTGRSDDVYDQLTEPARQLFHNPWKEPWMPARWLEEVGELSVGILGDDAFQSLTAVTMRERIGPILLPMIKSTLAHGDPGFVFKKMHDLTRVAVRGVGFLWQPEGPTAGVLHIGYPRVVRPHVRTSWVAVIDYVFELTAPGQLKQSTPRADGTGFTYVMTWPAPS